MIYCMIYSLLRVSARPMGEKAREQDNPEGKGFNCEFPQGANGQSQDVRPGSAEGFEDVHGGAASLVWLVPGTAEGRDG